MKTRNRTVGALLALSVALCAAGCAGQPLASSSLQGNRAQIDLSASSIKVLSMYKGTSVDVNLVDDPDLLTGQSKMVVEGKILSFSKGREWQFGGPENDSSYSTVMAVKVSKVFKGSEDAVGSTIYVEHFLAPDVTTDFLNANLVGYQCGLFLIPAAGEGYISLVDSAAGRPAGEALWVGGAQAFVIQDKTNQQVVWPQLDEVRLGTLDQAMPGGSLTPLTD